MPTPATAFKILVLTLVLLSFLGCSASSSDSAPASDAANASANKASNSNGTNDNIDELGLIFKLPSTPEEAVWKESGTGPDQSARKLTAVLRYSGEPKHLFESELSKNGSATRSSISPESWFPAELLAQSDTTGDDTLSGETYPIGSIAAEPYTSGSVTHIDGTDYFILEATAK